VFDRVKPKLGYVPDFIFLPSSQGVPGAQMSWLMEEQRHWLSTVDPGLRVRMRGEKAEVGGLAYSRWDGFAWLDCELTWPNRCRISRLKELGIYVSTRVGMPML
jgi:hypothetical protein